MLYKMISGEDSKDLSRMINKEIENNPSIKFAKILATSNIDINSIDIANKKLNTHIFSSEGIGDYAGKYYKSGVMVIFSDFDMDITIVKSDEIEKMPHIDAKFSFIYSNVDIISDFKRVSSVINKRHPGELFGAAFDDLSSNDELLEDSILIMTPKHDLEYNVYLTPHWDSVQDKVHEVTGLTKNGAISKIGDKCAVSMYNELLEKDNVTRSTLVASVNGNLSGVSEIGDGFLMLDGPVELGDLIYFCARGAKQIADDFFNVGKEAASYCMKSLICTDSQRVAIMDEFDTLMYLEDMKYNYFKDRVQTGFGGASRGVFYKSHGGKLQYKTHTVGFVGIVGDG